MTKVVNKYAIATGAGIMILAGFFPYIGTLLQLYLVQSLVVVQL